MGRMKTLVFPHHLEIGGSQTNAIDLATAMRDLLDHEIVFCATPGPAAELLAERGFRFIPLPRPRMAPSPVLSRAVYQVAQQERPDLLHAYDWQQILDGYYGAHMFGGVPMLGTIMSMAMLRMIPRTIPLTYGTPALTEAAARAQSAPVRLFEPPVDTAVNAPGAVDPEPFRKTFGLASGVCTVVVVSRLISWLKLEGIARAIDVVGQLSVRHELQFVIVGGGPMQAELQVRADRVNDKLGRRVIILTGPLLDPRPAYESADVAIGMGGSIIRAMSFAKPAIVLGESGFSQIFTPESSRYFLDNGFYGLGDPASPSDLDGQLDRLVGDEGLRDSLGRSARDAMIARFGLEACARTMDDVYAEAASWKVSSTRQLADAARTAGVAVAAQALPERTRQAVRRLGRAGGQVLGRRTNTPNVRLANHV